VALCHRCSLFLAHRHTRLLGLQAPAVATVAQLEGLDGQLVALVAPCEEGGRRTAVIAVAAAEAFPVGALEGAKLHWAAAPGPHRGWQGVPGGWTTEPENTRDAGVRPSQLLDVSSCLLPPRLAGRAGRLNDGARKHQRRRCELLRLLWSGCSRVVTSGSSHRGWHRVLGTAGIACRAAERRRPRTPATQVRRRVGVGPHTLARHQRQGAECSCGIGAAWCTEKCAQACGQPLHRFCLAAPVSRETEVDG